MKALHKYPHLFSNGKFQAQSGTFKGIINGLIQGDVCLSFQISDTTFVPVEKCTLIARPIESMTDGEWDEIDKLNDGKSVYDHCTRWEYYKGLWTIASNTIQGGITLNEANHLFSIGCYPFDQDDFEDGTVIDSRTLTEPA